MARTGSNIPKQVKQLPNGTVILKTTTKLGMRQIRCPKCHNLCGAARTPQGKSVTTCSSCNAQFTMTTMK